MQIVSRASLHIATYSYGALGELLTSLCLSFLIRGNNNSHLIGFNEN